MKSIKKRLKTELLATICLDLKAPSLRGPQILAKILPIELTINSWKLMIKKRVTREGYLRKNPFLAFSNQKLKSREIFMTKTL